MMFVVTLQDEYDGEPRRSYPIYATDDKADAMKYAEATAVDYANTIDLTNYIGSGFEWKYLYPELQEDRLWHGTYEHPMLRTKYHIFRVPSKDLTFSPK